MHDMRPDRADRFVRGEPQEHGPMLGEHPANRSEHLLLAMALARLTRKPHDRQPARLVPRALHASEIAAEGLRLVVYTEQHRCAYLAPHRRLIRPDVHPTAIADPTRFDVCGRRAQDERV